MRMKRMLGVILLAAALNLTVAVAARAVMQPVTDTDSYDDSQSHPLRIAAYLLYPVGYGLEWLVFRPFHRLVSEPTLAPIFGHVPHADDAPLGTMND
jgi:hypothetical protein